MARVHRWWGLGLVGLAAGLPLAAQSLWLPASDPVGIARGGAGIAFGQSLEAASLNPALLVTLRDNSSAFLGLGMDMAASQVTLQSNQRNLFSSERNRLVPSLGSHWRFSNQLAFGVKLDTPFLRHAELSPESSVRFLGRSLDLKAQRLEFQAAWALKPELSVGIGLGLARLSYASSVHFRAVVPQSPTQPVDPANPSLALVETEGQQEGSATAFSYSLGFRWAFNPRWTFAGAYQSSLKGTLGLSARPGDFQPIYVANDGFSTPPVGIGTLGSALLAQTHYEPGAGQLSLPGKASLGLRHRLNPFFTWEFDVRYVGGGSFQTPSAPVLVTPSGTVRTQALPEGFRSGFGASLMAEISLLKDWTFRLGAALEPALQADAAVNPIYSGARSAAFSAGAGYRIWGGELNAGYQFRQNHDMDGTGLEGGWNSTGYRVTGTTTRVEGMGHLWSIGFKRSF